MTKIAFRPYRGSDREEKLESDAVQNALLELLPGRVEIVDAFPSDTTHAFGRPPKNWWPRPPALVYPAAEHQKTAYYYWPGYLGNAGRAVTVHDLAGADKRVREIHATGTDAFVKATRDKFYTGVVPVGIGLAQRLDALVYSFVDCQDCLIVQPYVRMAKEYRIFVVDGVPVTGAGNVVSHTPAENSAPFDPLVSPHPTIEECQRDEALVHTYLDFAGEVIDQIPIKTFTLDVAMIDGKPGIVEINPLHLGQVGLFASDVRRLTAAVLKNCGLIVTDLIAA